MPKDGEMKDTNELECEPELHFTVGCVIMLISVFTLFEKSFFSDLAPLPWQSFRNSKREDFFASIEKIPK